MAQDTFKTLREFTPSAGKTGKYHSLAALEAAGLGKVSRLPRSIRVVLEALVRHCDGARVTEDHVRRLAAWEPKGARTTEIPFVVVRIVLQDLIGFGALNDLSAMRAAAGRLGMAPGSIEPLVPVDVVVDHSVEIDVHNAPDAVQRNQEIEFKRNAERYRFVKWAQGAFETVRVVPPGNGIIHQINMEHLSRGVWEKDGVWFPDTVFGTDSHTTMVNGIGIVAWGVGGIEAEAGMLGQPNAFLTPDVVGCHLTGRLREGVTATDLALTVTELMRKAKVVGKFVEFFGEGATALTAADRCTVANMAPEYGATMGYFPVDDKTVDYFRMTGREPELVSAIEAYYKAQGMFGMPQKGEIDYTEVIELDLASIVPSLSGPKRPQDRVNLPDLGRNFDALFSAPADKNGYARPAADLTRRVPSGHPEFDVGHGDVLISSITSCTNTSNPNVMIAAGLVAKKAVEAGISPPPYVKTSLAPGSRLVSEYLEKTGLQAYLDRIGFGVVGYGCTTCIGNSGPLDPAMEKAISRNDLVLASVLSGNRNFEARIHQSIRANFLMSPPLVVAFALAGRVDIDLEHEPLGRNQQGRDIYLRDLWPKPEEVREFTHAAYDAGTYRQMYSGIALQNPIWNEIAASGGEIYEWDRDSTYIREPPYFEGFQMVPGPVSGIRGARALAVFGDSVTTDHISPAGAIKPASPAGIFLQEKEVAAPDFNSYGSRRGNHEVMVRGTFANVRIRNLMAPGTEGGVTVHHPSGKQMSIYEASCAYRESGVPLLVFAGREYGTGSSRDWAAKGARLLGIRAVIAQSYERIHRSNLVGMGVLPCQFKEGMSARSLNLDGSESFDLLDIGDDLRPRQDLSLVIHRAGGKTDTVKLTLQVDTPIEADYYRHGGILPYVLRQLLR